MKRLTILALFLFPSVVCAQQRTAAISPESFEKRAEFSAAAFDIVWARPRHMIDLDTLAGQWIRRGHRSGTAYAPVLESENGEFILMYMSFLIYRTEGEIEMYQTMRKLEKSPPTNELLTNDNYPRLLITGESKAAYGYTEGFFNPVEGKVFTREDFKTYVTIVSGGKARRWFNADSVFLYTLPVDDPFKKGYTHCTGMIVSKKGRASIGLKLWFTNAGKKKEQQYLRSLRRKIRYRNDDWKYDREVFERAVRNREGDRK